MVLQPSINNNLPSFSKARSIPLFLDSLYIHIYTHTQEYLNKKPGAAENMGDKRCVDNCGMYDKGNM